MRELTILENLRRIRNDIQYYGTKSRQDIQEFYDENRKVIVQLLNHLKNSVRQYF